MKDEKAVDHPSHYEKGNGHIECIDLLSFITADYKGIYALEIGQSKYAYRAGTKGEAGLSTKEKTIQDFKKLKWYLEDFYKRVEIDMKINNLSFQDAVYVDGKKEYNKSIADILRREFSYDKPEEIKKYISDYVVLAYCLRNIDDLRLAIGIICQIIDIFSKKN